MTAGAAGQEGEARSVELRELADALNSVTRRVDGGGARDRALDRLTQATLEAIPGARAASVTVLDRGQFDTRAWTDELARAADALQYELGRGPCVDAVLEDKANISGDVSSDPRWGQWGPRVAADLGVRSVLAYRLRLEGEHRAIASLNVYATAVSAFDEHGLHLGVVLATHGSLLMSAVMARDVAENLADSLRANREVGVAMGVLMHRHRLTREQAFDLLRLASQELSMDVSEVAATVADTGDLAMLRAPLGAPRGSETANPSRPD